MKRLVLTSVLCAGLVLPAHAQDGTPALPLGPVGPAQSHFDGVSGTARSAVSEVWRVIDGLSLPEGFNSLDMEELADDLDDRFLPTGRPNWGTLSRGFLKPTMLGLRLGDKFYFLYRGLMGARSMYRDWQNKDYSSFGRGAATGVTELAKKGGAIMGASAGALVVSQTMRALPRREPLLLRMIGGAVGGVAGAMLGGRVAENAVGPKAHGIAAAMAATLGQAQTLSPRVPDLPELGAAAPGGMPPAPPVAPLPGGMPPAPPITSLFPPLPDLPERTGLAPPSPPAPTSPLSPPQLPPAGQGDAAAGPDAPGIAPPQLEDLLPPWPWPRPPRSPSDPVIASNPPPAGQSTEPPEDGEPVPRDPERGPQTPRLGAPGTEPAVAQPGTEGGAPSGGGAAPVIFAVSISVDPLKPDGSTWDVSLFNAVAARPDIQICRVEAGTRTCIEPEAPACPDSLNCDVDMLATGLVSLEILDVDQVAHDVIGQGSCAGGFPCQLGSAVLNLR